VKFYQKTIDEILRELDAGHEGLTLHEAARRLKLHGPNQINVKGAPLWKKIIEPFWNVMIAVLAVAGGLSIWHGEYVDAGIIFAIIMISAIIDWVQQFSTERILRSLRKREIEPVEVYRNGNVSQVSSEDLVVGDVIILHEGQKIPADARVLEAENLELNESILTGESLNVEKNADTLPDEKEIYEQANMVFGGSFVATGAGLAIITATGNNTEFGRLAKLAGDSNVESPLQQKIDGLVKIVIVVVFAFAAAAFILQLARGTDLTEALQFTLAFAVSAVPEGLPIAIAVVLALGTRRMAAKKALVRNMRAIENIGLVTTVATDKTGTLTRNELRVQETWSPRFHPAAFALHLSFTLNETKGSARDPLDTALELYLKTHKISLKKSAAFVENLPFDYELAMSGNIWKFGQKYEIYVKGAPEKILSRCRLAKSEEANIEAKLHDFAQHGFRVIAFAKDSTTARSTTLTAALDHDIEFLGFVAIADDLRPRVVPAIHEATAAGVRVRMITGDHAETAYHIAHEIDIADDPSQVYDSRELLKLPADKLAEIVENTRVYARVIPEAKHRILTELNKTDITAMTGDGVNDVPALSQAHVGIAMGAGAAIAKDASDIVLLDNNFRSIVTAIREGRIIIANVRRMLVYLLATNAGEVLVMLGALLLGMPLPLVAVQILWVNLATDTFMVIPLGLEPGDKNIMKQKPAHPNAPVLDKFLLSRVVVAAVVMAAAVLIIFHIFLNKYGLDEARSAAFLALIVIQWANALAMRGEESLWRLFWVKNRVFFWALGGAIIAQFIVIIVPAFRAALHLKSVHADVVWACSIVTLAMLIILELHKWLGRVLRRRKVIS
jgi:Ca2+-transporting ATPase